MTKTAHSLTSRLMAPLCAAAILTILVAGLWPFVPPRNNVQWLRDQNGVRIGHHGLLVSAQPLHPASPDGSYTLEILLRPDSAADSGTILAFDDSPDPSVSMAVRQFGNRIVIQRPSLNASGQRERLWWSTSDVLTPGRWTVLTVVSSGLDSTLFADGRKLSTYPGYGSRIGDLSGRLTLGTGIIRDDWRGSIAGIALYGLQLSPDEVQNHARQWLTEAAPTSDAARKPAILYLFHRRDSRSVAEDSGQQPSLVFPSRYALLHPVFLSPPWKQFRSRWDGWRTRSYLSDVLLNIFGFIPLGFLLTGCTASTTATRKARIRAVVLGFIVSLVIETLQYFLPTRDSSMTDLTTNTVGTLIGAALWRRSWSAGTARKHSAEAKTFSIIT